MVTRLQGWWLWRFSIAYLWRKLQCGCMLKTKTGRNRNIEIFNIYQHATNRYSLAMDRWPITTCPRVALGCSNKVHPDGHIWQVASVCSWTAPNQWRSASNKYLLLDGLFQLQQFRSNRSNRSCFWPWSNQGVEHQDTPNHSSQITLFWAMMGPLLHGSSDWLRWDYKRPHKLKHFILVSFIADI